MNEELQKELLAVLRSMRDGAPDAWRELVAQRSIYCLTTGIAMVGLALVIMLIAATVAWRSRKGPFFVDDATPTIRFVGFLGGLIVCAFALIPICHAIPYIAEGFAPLGRMLEAIR